MIKKGLIIGDGSMKVDTSAFGVYVTDAGVYPPTSRNYNMVHISGRNGDLSIDGNDFSNGTLRFPACMLMDGIESANSADYIAFKGALNRMTGYQKIVDPFLANYYRMGIFTNNSEPKWSADKSLWVFDLKFNAKPQLFLNEGDAVKSFTANSTLKNPTGYITRPLLRIYGKAIS